MLSISAKIFNTSN